MLHSGPAFSVTALDDGIVEVKFDLAGESVNKINALALQDFAAATQAIATDASVKGVILTSGKGVFIVGADITEFGALVRGGPDAHRQAPARTSTRSWRASRTCQSRASPRSTASASAAALSSRWRATTG